MLVLVDADSIAYASAYAMSRKAMVAHVDSVFKNIVAATGCDVLEVWVENPEGKNIFRNHVAVTKPYKGNRTEQQRPRYLQSAKEYIKSEYGGNLTRHLETEDVVIIRAYEIGLQNCVIAAIDKDLHQVPALFYDYKNSRFVEVDEGQAEFNFWSQVLTGDPSDNIPGLHKIGKAKARKILEQDMPYCVSVAEAYAKAGHSYEYLVEQCRLLYLLRHWKDVFVFPLTKEEYLMLGEGHG